MIGIDTNVLVRLVTRDDPLQTSQAEHLLDTAGREGLFVNLVVLAELSWVLRRAYRFEAATVLEAIEGVLEGREFVVERASIARMALDNARRVRCGFADALIDCINNEAGVRETVTFDIKAKRLPTMRDLAAGS